MPGRSPWGSLSSKLRTTFAAFVLLGLAAFPVALVQVNAALAELTPPTVTTLAGSGQGSADGTGGMASFNRPAGVAVDSAGNVYVADTFNNEIRKITPEGVTTTLAGSLTQGYQDGPGETALFRQPTGVAVDSEGNLYVADQNNHKIRMITPEGVVSTLAGSGAGYTDATGTNAKFQYPRAVAVDSAGNLYVADQNNHKIRKIAPGGVVTTLAGSGQGSADGTGTAASFAYPRAVAVDGVGNVYVADQFYHKIRMITPAGVVTTLAGSGSNGSADGTGAAASFYNPYGVAVDSAGNVYVGDQLNHRIRKIAPGGVVTTLAGSGSGFADGTTETALFSQPNGVAVDSAGNVYVADANNNKIRKITLWVVVAQSFAIDRHVIAGGGGGSEGGGFSIVGTIGQADAGPTLTDGNFTLVGGFHSSYVAVQMPGAPRLTLVKSGANVTLSWPADGSTGFVLETSGSVAPGSAWTTVPGEPTLGSGEKSVTLTAQPGNHFFRLRKQ